uniref:Disease resistance R13L4/SHOC-2-like LRR domain-containing protein n=1 Tax=Aegilops tauschii TaxID=37682 RepID=M8BLN9_AEGTA
MWDLRLHRLDIRSTLIRQLPKEMWRLRRLRHLLVDGDGVNQDGTEIPLGSLWRSMFWLHTLETIDLTGFPARVVEKLGRLRFIRVLSIIWALNQCIERSYQEALCSSIKAWWKLESLTIHCGIGCSMEFLEKSLCQGWCKELAVFKVKGGTFPRIPKLIAGRDKFTSIEITVCRLMPVDLSILGSLPYLQCLVLGLNFVPQEAIVIDGVGFPGLENLSVSCRVPWLTFEQGAMQQLTYLELKIADSPASQESIPSGFINLLSLSEVAIRYNVRYANSPSVKMTEEAVREQVAGHCDLFINGKRDQQDEAGDEHCLIAFSLVSIDEDRRRAAALKWAFYNGAITPAARQINASFSEDNAGSFISVQCIRWSCHACAAQS